MGVLHAKSEFAKLVRTARLQKNLSQAQVAALLGVKQSAVSAWELEKAVPEMATIPDLAIVLDLDQVLLIELKNQAQAAARPRGGRGGRRSSEDDLVVQSIHVQLEDMTPEERAEVLKFINEKLR